jgi:hypothetical protein
MIGRTTDYIGAMRRCIGDDLGPAPRDIDMVAIKIWRDCIPGGVGSDGRDWPPPSADHIFYRRAAQIALEGLGAALAL